MIQLILDHNERTAFIDGFLEHDAEFSQKHHLDGVAAFIFDKWIHSENVKSLNNMALKQVVKAENLRVN